MPSPHRSSRSANAAILLLALALLFAQWIGLKHRIAHADGHHAPHQLAQASVSAPGQDSDDLHHSCAAFDAATLADSIGNGPLLPVLLPNLHTLALWLAFASWDAPLVCHFSSRAPPA